MCGLKGNKGGGKEKGGDRANGGERGRGGGCVGDR